MWRLFSVWFLLHGNSFFDYPCNDWLLITCLYLCFPVIDGRNFLNEIVVKQLSLYIVVCSQANAKFVHFVHKISKIRSVFKKKKFAANRLLVKKIHWFAENVLSFGIFLCVKSKLLFCLIFAFLRLGLILALKTTIFDSRICWNVAFKMFEKYVQTIISAFYSKFKIIKPNHTYLLPQNTGCMTLISMGSHPPKCLVDS